jgi:S-DNA-T family DNA segregation ATPase FtsK/SpoIIIE
MAKKQPKKNAQPKKHDITEAKGVFFLALSLIIFLSMMSFSLHSTAGKNWLGATGHLIGWILTASFGLGSYFMSIYFGWIGWRLVFKKPVNHPAIKTLSVFTGIISICFLFSII